MENTLKIIVSSLDQALAKLKAFVFPEWHTFFK